MSLSAIFNPGTGKTPAWQDLTLNPVTNDSDAMNVFGLDISSIFIDPHDTTGNTVYVTVAGMQSLLVDMEVVYRSTDGGAHWTDITSNLPWAPANSLVVDPQDANTVYIATDMGVYSTRQVATCANLASTCWSVFGTGLPQSPVVQLSAAPVTSSAHLLSAATYGRGIWQIPLWTAGENLTTATVAPTTLTFSSQIVGSGSSAQTVTLTNTGSAALMPTALTASGDFSESDNCLNAIVNAGGNCADPGDVCAHSGGQPNGTVDHRRQRFGRATDGVAERNRLGRGNDQPDPGRGELWQCRGGNGILGFAGDRPKQRRNGGFVQERDYRALRHFQRCLRRNSAGRFGVPVEVDLHAHASRSGHGNADFYRFGWNTERATERDRGSAAH